MENFVLYEETVCLLCLGIYSCLYILIHQTNKKVFMLPIDPRLKWTIVNNALYPILSGTGLSALIIIGISSVIYLFDTANLLANIPFNFEGIQTIEQHEVTYGRMGVVLMISGIILTSHSCQLFIPVVTRKEEKIIQKHLDELRSIENNDSVLSSASEKQETDQDSSIPRKKHGLDGSVADGALNSPGSESKDEEEVIEEQKTEENRTQQDSIISLLKWKRWTNVFTLIFYSIVLLYFMECIYVESDFSVIFIIIANLIEPALAFLLNRWMSEAIYIPVYLTLWNCMTTFLLYVYMVTQRIYWFEVALLSKNLYDLLIFIYLERVLAFLKGLWREKWGNHRRNPNESLVSGFERGSLVTLVLEKETIQNISKHKVEDFMVPLIVWVSKLCSLVNLPLIYFMEAIFTQKMQSSQFEDKLYECLDTFFVNLTCLLVFLFALNDRELVTKEHLQSYLFLGKYRARNRGARWVFEQYTLSKYINIKYRSIDASFFSVQLYLGISLMTWGCLLFIFGIHFAGFVTYNPFGDPALPLIYVMVFVSMAIGHWVILRITNLIGYSKHRQGSKEELKFINAMIEQEPIVNLDDDAIREHFVRFNREWILQHLKNILTREDFESNSGQILNIYQHLSDMKIKEEKEKKKNEVNSGDSAQKDQMDSQQRQTLFNAGAGTTVKATVLFQYWKGLAKDFLHLKRIVNPIKQSKKSNHCAKCRSDNNLTVEETKFFYDLVRQFRVIIVARSFKEEEWKAFYESNQRFETLCEDCKIIIGARMRRKMFSESKYFRNYWVEKKSMVFDKEKMQEAYEKNELPPMLHKVMIRWLFSAKSSFLHQKHKRG